MNEMLPVNNRKITVGSILHDSIRQTLSISVKRQRQTSCLRVARVSVRVNVQEQIPKNVAHQGSSLLTIFSLGNKALHNYPCHDKQQSLSCLR